LAIAEMMRAGENCLAYFRKVVEERLIMSGSGLTDDLGASQESDRETIQIDRSTTTTNFHERITDFRTIELPPASDRTHGSVTIQNPIRKPSSSSGLKGLPGDSNVDVPLWLRAWQWLRRVLRG